MRRSLFKPFIMSRKLTSWRLVRGISTSIWHQRALLHLFGNCLFISSVFVWAEPELIAYTKHRSYQKKKIWFEQGHGDALCRFNGFFMVCINSDRQSRQRRTSALSTQALCSTALALSVKHVLACLRHITSGRGHLWRQAPAPVQGASEGM